MTFGYSMCVMSLVLLSTICASAEDIRVGICEGCAESKLAPTQFCAEVIHRNGFSAVLKFIIIAAGCLGKMNLNVYFTRSSCR